MEKLLLRSNFSSFPQYFQYFANFKSQIHIYLLNVVNQIIFSWTLQIWYVQVRISWSISESPLEFKIMRVDRIILSPVDQSWLFYLLLSIKTKSIWYKFLKFLGMTRLQIQPQTSRSKGSCSFSCASQTGLRICNLWVRGHGFKHNWSQCVMRQF